MNHEEEEKEGDNKENNGNGGDETRRMSHNNNQEKEDDNDWKMLVDEEDKNDDGNNNGNHNNMECIPVTLTRDHHTKTTATKNSHGDVVTNEWKQVCGEWGMTIVRHVYLLDHSTSNGTNPEDVNSANDNDDDDDANVEYEYKIMKVNDIHDIPCSNKSGDPYKVYKEQLVISRMSDNHRGDGTNCSDDSPAGKAGIRVGDIIHSIYGMPHPHLRLLFGVMRDSNSFQMEILRKRNPNQPSHTNQSSTSHNITTNDIPSSSPRPKNHYLSFNKPRKVFNPYQKQNKTKTNTNPKTTTTATTTYSKGEDHSSESYNYQTTTTTTNSSSSPIVSSSIHPPPPPPPPPPLSSSSSSSSSSSQLPNIPTNTISTHHTTIAIPTNTDTNTSDVAVSNTIINTDTIPVARNSLVNTKINFNPRTAIAHNNNHNHVSIPYPKKNFKNSSTLTKNNNYNVNNNDNNGISNNNPTSKTQSSKDRITISSSATTTTTSSSSSHLIGKSTITNLLHNDQYTTHTRSIKSSTNPTCDTTIISHPTSNGNHNSNAKSSSSSSLSFKEYVDHSKNRIRSIDKEITNISSSLPFVGNIHDDNEIIPEDTEEDAKEFKNMIHKYDTNNNNNNNRKNTHRVTNHDADVDDNAIVVVDSPREDKKEDDEVSLFPFPLLEFLPNHKQSLRNILLNAFRNPNNKNSSSSADDDENGRPIIILPKEYQIFKKKKRITHLPTGLSFTPEFFSIVQETLEIEMEYYSCSDNDCDDKKGLSKTRGAKTKLKKSLSDAICKQREYKIMEDRMLSSITGSISSDNSIRKKQKKRKNNPTLTSSDDNIEQTNNKIKKRRMTDTEKDANSNKNKADKNKLQLDKPCLRDATPISKTSFSLNNDNRSSQSTKNTIEKNITVQKQYSINSSNQIAITPKSTSQRPETHLKSVSLNDKSTGKYNNTIATDRPKSSLASLVKQSFSSLHRESKQSCSTDEDSISINPGKNVCESKELSFSTSMAEDIEDGLEVVPAKPAAVMKQSIMSRGTTITSTSSKAGLSQMRSLKLKRLWPDSTLFTKRIMKWNPPNVPGRLSHNQVKFRGPVASGNGTKNLTQIPQFFDSGMDMRAAFGSFILEEGIAAVNKEFEINSSPDGDWKRDTYSLQLKSCTPVDPKRSTGALSTVRTYEFAFDIDRKNSTDPPANLGELFVVYSKAWKLSGCCIGLVGSNDMNSTFLQDQKLESDESAAQFKLWLCVSSSNFENSGWLAESDLPEKLPNGSIKRQSMNVLNIGTVATSMREYEALISIDYLKNHLKNAIFTKGLTKYSKKSSETDQSITDVSGIKKPSSVPIETWQYLSATLNRFQLLAIEKLMSGKVKENVMLIQGPPGTGKTSTVIGLVSALVNGSCPNPGAKSPGTRVQVGKALSASNSNRNKSSVPGSLNANRILICAPSNFAVDEIAWRLKRFALGPHEKLGGLKIIRFGNLPDEERHDGRGKTSGVKISVTDSERDRFLRSINLDEMVEQIARKREKQNFAADRESEVKNRLNRRGTRHISFTQERQNILCNCDVVCCTLSGAGSKAFAEAVARDEFPHSEFDTVIIDEACQASEPSTLIPLKFNPNSLILVGDPQQLPVVVVSPKASKFGLSRSLFERLCENGWPVELLRIQYRMHKEIVSFPSEQFYESKLINDASIEERKSAAWHNHVGFPPYLVWNLSQGNMSRTKYGGIRNNLEVDFIMRIIQNFGYEYGGSRKISIGIIAFYNEQVSLLRVALNRLKKSMKNSFGNISFQISTVDGFQGSEKDIIILSCVRSYTRSNESNAIQSIGFLSDHRRVNVALTRARYSIWIIGNCHVLSNDPVWKALLDRAYDRNKMANYNQFAMLISSKNPVNRQKILSLKNDNSTGNGTSTGSNRRKKGKSKGRKR